MSFSFRRLIVLAAFASVPRVAQAQFTTFIPPQNKVADSVKAAVAAAQTARADSAVNMQLTNMKTWVDSAAGLTPAPATAADSLATSRAAAESSTTFRNGARAPSTASPLPLLALLGALLLVAGTVLLARPEPAGSRNSA